MDFGSLHPVSIHHVQQYLTAAGLDQIETGRRSAHLPTARELHRLSFGLAVELSRQQPVFAGDGFSLSAWEARVDRGIGMLMRPPSRLFLDAGLDQIIARKMDIRLDLAGTSMGGAYIPPHLVDQCGHVVDRHFERSVKRMDDAGMDAAQMLSIMTEAVRFASANGFGLYEASGVLDPYDSSSWPEGAQVVTGSRDSELLRRIEIARRPPQEDGLIRRSLRKFGIG